MKQTITALAMALVISTAGTGFAVGPDKVLEFKGSTEGTVVFNGATHRDAGLTCKDCHNPEIFPKMKQGTVRITMNELYAGKYCGRCHDGKKAFMIKDNCTRCHHKPGIK